MEIVEILFIAVGLAMDAFAVSVTSGITIQQLKISHAFRIALIFGLFQAFMPLLGWGAGLSLKDFIMGIDHWIAFGLLSVIGCKMIYESLKMETGKNRSNVLDMYILLILSIATSIDALVVGVSFAFLKVSIIMPIIIIGVVTFVLSFLGVFVGDKFGHFCEKKIGIIGGIILIVIGIKILVEHLL
jgi:putative Mn2+ efflux pump MntP